MPLTMRTGIPPFGRPGSMDTLHTMLCLLNWASCERTISSTHEISSNDSLLCLREVLNGSNTLSRF